MKIGSVESKPAITTPAERKPSATATATASASASGGKAEASAQVDLSAAATVLAEQGSDPAFDSAKVQGIAQAIRDGRFTVNAEAIADKLITNAEELLGRKLSS